MYIYINIKQAQNNWDGFKGFVTLEMFEKCFPKPDEFTLATLCGPKLMNKLVV